MMIKNLLKLIEDIFLNIFFSKKYDLVYIIEGINWSIGWDGKHITKNLNEQKLIKSKISTTHIGLKNKIIHFGSVNTLISQKGIKKVHSSNKIVLTWFHIAPNDQRVKFIPDLNSKVNIIHTSCNLTREKLKQYGADDEKIIVVPLGVDLEIFKPYDRDRIKKIKKDLNLPEKRIIIGSFQKDGCGWGEGLRPKMEKGPDIFCDALEKISKKHAVHALLTGPARGYVKKRLENSGISYTHKFLKNYQDTADYYNTLDLYLITSREEGGPKAVLESMACGIPLVSTPVGMTPQIITDGINGLLSKKYEAEEIFEKTDLLLSSNVKNTLINNGLGVVRNYDWKEIAINYFNKIYKKLC